MIAQNPIFPAAVNNEHFFSHTDRLHLLTEVIAILQETYGFQPKLEHVNFKIKYEDDISHYRNALGHRKSGEDTIEIMCEMIPIDETLHQKLRKNLNHYDALIEELEVLLLSVYKRAGAQHIRDMKPSLRNYNLSIKK